ncbi:helix-turn-helix domain-containing protein [Gracilimonas sp. Q87]|uniref:helix-turn-helix domain-containing protein n=1 Tax=Gracilimonas sp. Q87 TaxID=3384766 RepID=UPI0039842390
MNIKKLRKSLGFTQTEFAKHLGTTQRTVCEWENGQCPAYIDNLAKLALKKEQAK